MKTIFTYFFLLITFCAVHAQTIADFEGYELPLDTFLNGSQGNESFISGDIELYNDFNAEWGSWSGWSISTMRDVETPDFTNDLSVISGSGYESDTYAVAYANSSIHVSSDLVVGAYLNNSTYAYHTIKDGSQFSKKFGGAEGTDPDYFVVHFLGYEAGEVKDTVDFYLADFRGDDDYIVDEWTWVDFSSFGYVDSIGVVFESSDVGDFGINTPLYFCMDNFTTKLESSTAETQIEALVYPNPTTEKIWIKTNHELKNVGIFDRQGRLQKTKFGYGFVDVSHLLQGTYTIVVETPTGISTKQIIKL